MNYTEIEMEWMKEILRDKEEEIKKLKSDLSLVIKERDDNIEQNKKLKEYNRRLKQGNEDLKEQNKKLSEKNGQLKSDLAFNKSILDNVKAEYESLKNVIKELKHERDMHRDAAKDCWYDIKELKERIRFLEQCLDNKEKVNISLREELERFRNMWDSWEF